SFDLDGDVYGRVDTEARASGFARSRNRSFEDPGKVEDAGIVGRDRFAVPLAAPAGGQLVQSIGGKLARVPSFLPNLSALGCRSSRLLARGDGELVAIVRSTLA